MIRAKTPTAAGRGGHRLFHAVVLVGISLPTATACGGSVEMSPTPGTPTDAAGENNSPESSVERDASWDTASTDAVGAQHDTGAPDAAQSPVDSGQDAGLQDAMEDGDACVPGRGGCCPHPCVLVPP